MTTEDRTEELLSRAFQQPMTATGRTRLDAWIGGLLEQAPARRRPFRPRLRRGLVLVVGVSLLIPAVVAAGVMLRSTEAPYGMGSAADYDAELAAAKAVTPIPPGSTWPPYLEGAVDRNASYGVGLGQSMVENNAYCLWLGDWYDARQTGDQSRVAAARYVLDQARGWESFNDLGADTSFRVHINGVIDAVDDGDDAIVLNELTVNCSGTWHVATER